MNQRVALQRPFLMKREDAKIAVATDNSNMFKVRTKLKPFTTVSLSIIKYSSFLYQLKTFWSISNNSEGYASDV
jgi:hypothetical protein